MDLTGRTAVVTGAAGGIGRALALALRDTGARLVLADREAVRLQQVADETDALAVPADVSLPEEYERLAEAAGVPALLCLNAGVVSSWPGPVWEAPADEWRRVLDINLGGVVNGLRAFVPRMLATVDHHRILITASLAGVTTWPGGGPYGASKHAVVTVAEQAALALEGRPVDVTVLCPALVRSGMSQAGEDPAVVAREALRAVERGSFAVMPEQWTGAVVERARRLAAGEPPAPPTPH